MATLTSQGVFKTRTIKVRVVGKVMGLLYLGFFVLHKCSCAAVDLYQGEAIRYQPLTARGEACQKAVNDQGLRRARFSPTTMQPL